MKYYAGIGSRYTPVEIQEKMTLIAERLSRHSYCLRSGGAPGADIAFQKGSTHKQIFLPWAGFNGNKGADFIVPKVNVEFVRKYHPKPNSLSEAGLKLMSRNSYQVLGLELNDPVEFVICWTKDGKASGGTGQALRIAKDYNIPIFNLKNGFNEFSTYMTFSLF